jgi:CheY-like chemotaxis protein
MGGASLERDPPVGHPQRPPNAAPLEGLALARLGEPGGALARLERVRVLVVEDNSDSRELIRELLEMAGATVLCVGSVAEAMNGHSFDPDVVLTDFAMPGADGFDLIREFRKAPSTRAVAVPILILSGRSGNQWRAEALEAGAADVLSKPVDPALLIICILAAIARGPECRSPFVR